MIAALLILGLLDPPTGDAVGDLIASADQVAAVTKIPVTVATGSTIPLNAPAWPRPFDPADRAPYAWDFGPVLEGGAKIAYIEELIMSAAGAAAGVQIDQQAPRLPVIAEDGTHVQVWFLIDPASQNADLFAGAGLAVPIAARIRTTDPVPQYYRRSLVLTVRRQ